MNYPRCLYQRNRKKLDDSQIKNNHYLFMRNKPGFSWDIEENIPDFSQISSNQSFNWCRYSIPQWVRFNEKKKYLIDYAIVGIKSKVIRYSKKHDNNLENFIYNVTHVPLDFNYSHCELFQKKEIISKLEKRAFRMILKFNCKIYLNPYKEYNLFIILYHLSKMLLYKIF